MLSFLSLVLLAHGWLVSPSEVHRSPDIIQKNIFISDRHSNMAGCGRIVNVWDGIVLPKCQPKTLILRLSAGLLWQEAHEPLHADNDFNRTCGVGPGMAFANAVLEKDSSFGVVGLVPCAMGGTGISQRSRGTELYSELVRRAGVALQDGGTIQAILWYQGENDTVSRTDAQLYKQKLEKFFLDLQTDLQSPLLPIIQVALASGQGPFIETVREAHLGIDLPNVICVDRQGTAIGTRWPAPQQPSPGPAWRDVG